MFTGIIEKKSEVLSNIQHQGTNRLIVSSDFTELQVGESIAVNGVCLTLLPSDSMQLNFDLSPETLQCTTLARLVPGDRVNLERAMNASTRFGGHYVSGHVDTIAQVNAIKNINDCIELELGQFDPLQMMYLVPKGSITVEGVSLTINSVAECSIKLMLIPHTLFMTTLDLLKEGQWVNIEFDYLTRIVAHQLEIAGKLRITK